jgi:hypothetical protein
VQWRTAYHSRRISVHELLEHRNPKDREEFLAEDAVFLSPIVHKPQQGKLLTIGYLAAAFKVLFNGSFR